MRYYNPVAGTGGVSQLPLERPTDFGTTRNPMSAFVSYSLLGVLDPKNPFVEARGIAAATGFSYSVSLGMAMVMGGAVAGALLTPLDPQHRFDGGFDDTALGERYYNRPTFHSSLGSRNPRDAYWSDHSDYYSRP